MQTGRLTSLLWFLICAAACGAGVRRHTYDFNGDGIDDIGVYVRSTGQWFVRNSATLRLDRYRWGWQETTPAVGDYDGDGKADPAVYHRRTGNWHILYSTSGFPLAFNWGWHETTAVPADYDGDGRTDVAVFHRRTGDWYIIQSRDGLRILNWGWDETRPVPADYDGDGRADIAVYHPATGDWYIVESRTGHLRIERVGGPEAVPVPGYYDADRFADVAVYSPPQGLWQIMDSSLWRVRRVSWGWQATVPVPADYDGDAVTDIAVYDPAGGQWYLILSAFGLPVFLQGGNTDTRPLPVYAHGATDNIRVHCQGDSITYGMGSASDGPATGYPLRLEKALEGGYGGDFISLNYGVPGETTSRGAARLPAQLDASRARVLLIMEGTNDHFFNVPFSTIEANLRRMVAAGRSRGMFVAIATIPPVMPSRRPGQYANIRAFNPRIYAIAADYGIPVAPVYEYMTSVPGWEWSLMDPSTANHPNEAGYSYVRDAFYDALAPHLDFGDVY